MAIKATIFKVELNIADMDRGYYESHALTLARHPSETDERMMVRVLAFALSAHERLEFGSGVSTDDEPDLWLRSLSGQIEQWIDVGLPDPRRIRKACGRSDAVTVYCYGGNKAATWWRDGQEQLAQNRNLTVFNLPQSQIAALADLVERGISLQCNVQDGEVWMVREDVSVHVTPESWLGAEGAGGAARGSR